MKRKNFNEIERVEYKILKEIYNQRTYVICMGPDPFII